jgi:diguanylate cyclase (GGDEF)-like protein/PAS domain S-box-containing protein
MNTPIARQARAPSESDTLIETQDLPRRGGSVSVLCLGDSADRCAATRRALEGHSGFRVLDVDATIGLRAQLERDRVDVVVCCLTQCNGSNRRVLDVVAETHPTVPVVVLTEPGMEEGADEAILHGAWGCILQTPHFIHRLSHSIRSAVAQRRLVEEKQKTEQALGLALRARRVLGECNRVLLRANDEQALLADMCRIVVEDGGYRLAWIGKAMHDERRSIRPVSRHGEDHGYVDALSLTWGPETMECGLAGRAIRTGGAQVARSVRTDPAFSRWREMALACDFGAAAALPLTCGGSTLGVLALYAREEHSFDASELSLLEELAADIAYGVANLRLQDEKQRAEAELEASQSRFEATFSQAPVGLAHVDLTGRFIRVNAAYCDLLGYQADELRARSFFDVTFPGDVESSRRWLERVQRGESHPISFEKRYRRKDGSVVWVALSVSRARTLSCEPSYLITVAHDITSRKATEQQLAFLGQYDPLTRLANRRLLLERLEEAIAEATHGGHRAGLIYLDLDRFKDINDTYGHATGDALLTQISLRLAGSIRAGNTLGRLGGDEFAIVVPGVQYSGEETIVAQRILDNLAAPFEVDAKRFHVTASLGISMYPTDGSRPEVLLRNADAAMYEAKQGGRSNFKHYLPSMSSRKADRIRLEEELWRALDREEFALHFQPKFGIKSERIAGFEALLRWNHPDRGLVAPSSIIPILESTGLIIPVGEWVLRTVCAQLQRWHEQGISGIPVAVNVSARQFQQRNLDTIVSRVLAEYGLPPSTLQLELTESVLMNDAEESIRSLAALKAAGLSIAIDDFGTGYSSLAYLSRFPVDALKIDRTFVRNVIADPSDASITAAVIKLAHSVGVQVVAEGVETREQLDFLRERNCDEVQGYLMAPPLTAAECTAMLGAEWKLP